MLNIAWRLDWLASLVFRTKRKITKQGSLSVQNSDLISNEKIKNYLNYSFENITNYIDLIAPDFKKNVDNP